MGAQPGARRLPHHRRGAVVGPRALHRRGHGLLGHGHRPDEPTERLRGHVDLPAQAVALRRRRQGDRALRLARWRDLVEEDHDDPGRAHGPYRSQRGAVASEHRLPDHRVSHRRHPLHVRRLRRDVDDGQRQQESDQLPTLLLLRRLRRPVRPRDALHALGRAGKIDRRGPHLRAHRQRRARRPPGVLDRSGRRRARALRLGRRHAGVVRWRCQLPHLPQLQPRAVLPHLRRRPRSLLRVRRAAGQRQLVRPEPAQRSPRHPARLLLHGVRRRRLLHRAGAGSAEPGLLERPGRLLPHHGHQLGADAVDRAVAAHDRFTGAGHVPGALPLQLGRADRHLAARPGHRVLGRQRRLPQQRLRPLVGRVSAPTSPRTTRKSSSIPAARSTWTTPPPNSTPRFSPSPRTSSSRA